MTRRIEDIENHEAQKKVDTKTSEVTNLDKPKLEKNKSNALLIMMAILGYGLLIVGLIFGYGAFYLSCFATGAEHIKVSLLSLPGLLIAGLFGGDIVAPFFIAATSIIGGICIFKFGDRLFE